MVSKKQLQKEIEDLKQKLMMQNISIVQMNMEKREMFMGPNEFIISINQAGWKDIKISFREKDITDKAIKVILFGPGFLDSK